MKYVFNNSFGWTEYFCKLESKLHIIFQIFMLLVVKKIFTNA